METNTSDFYDILGIKKNATQNEIKSAYRKLVLKYHPDRNHDPDANDKFRKIQIAYETIIDVEKRNKYDLLDDYTNNLGIKNIFMYYQELVIEICEKYELKDNERQEILNLFDPQDIERELLENNNINLVYKNLADKLFNFIPKFMVNKISENHPYIGYGLKYIMGWFL